MVSCDNNYCINDSSNNDNSIEDWCFDDLGCDENCALASILQSIAMMETSLSLIICAEGIKIKKAVYLANDLNELIRINESVKDTIDVINQLEDALKQKTIYAIEALKDLRTKTSL